MPVPPHAHREIPPDTAPHPVIAAAYAAARGSAAGSAAGDAAGDAAGGRAAPPVPARHKAPLRPPSRRAWVAVGLLVALTALPTLVVILAGRAALQGPDDRQPYRADGGRPVVIEPGPGGANRHNDAAAAPEIAGGVTPSTPAGAGGAAGGDRAEATPCPTVSGPAAGGAAAPGGAAAAGGGAPPAGGGSSGSGSTGDAGSGAQGAPGAPGGGAPGGVAPSGGAPSGGDGSVGGDHGSHDGGSHDSDDQGDDPPPQSGGGSNESAPGRNFIERVFDELGIPLP